MEQGEAVSTRDLLNTMPPVEHAPVLERLGSLGYNKFRDQYAIETPVDPETGIVDHDELIRQVSGFVSDTYKWKAPFFDEHHLHWYGRQYNEHTVNAEVASEFRDLALHKLWVPRQFHDFVHLMTLPPEVPSVDVMRQSVKDFRRRNYLYQIATRAIELRERSLRMKRYDNGNEILFIDPVTRRATRNEDSYDTRRRDFIHVIERHHRRGLIDLSSLSPVELQGMSDIEEALPEIQQFVAAGIIRARGRASRSVDLRVDYAA